MTVSSTGAPGERPGGGLLDESPTPSWFDPWALPEPTGDWCYWLDDREVIYGPGAWPFYNEKMEVVQFHRRRAFRRHRRLLRLVPSTLYGEQERHHRASLMLGPRNESAFVTFEVFVRREGEGGILERLDARLVVADSSWMWPREPREEIRVAAESKRDKVLGFLRNALEERDRGLSAPRTAQELWRAAQTSRH